MRTGSGPGHTPGAVVHHRNSSALAAWGGRYESETYDARHGWTVPDSAVYNEAEAERAYAKLRALFAEMLM